MADLRNTLEKYGFEAVETYIQSGNILLEAREKSEETVTRDLHDLISNEFGIDVPVWVYSAETFVQIAKTHPFDVNIDLSKLHITFLRDEPEADNVAVCASFNFDPDLFSIQRDYIYIYCPNGYGRTKINNQFFEKKLKVTATTRNWKTVQKLLEMIQVG